MFKKISKMSIKVTNFCNLNCVYCHQLSSDKNNTETFTMYKELRSFLQKVKFNDEVDVTITGGEISLRLQELRKCINFINSIPVDTKFHPNIVTNGSNIKGVLKLVNSKKIRPCDVTLSWDGIHSYTKTRRGKNNAYSDAFFNNNIKTIAEYGYGKQINIVFAITPYNIDEMYDSLIYALDNGMQNFSYYFIHEGIYEDKAFVDKFQLQLQLVLDEFKHRYNTEKRFSLYNLQSYYSRKVEKADFLSSISCLKLGNTLHFDSNGDIYGCIFFGDHKALQLGSILDGGIYPDRLEKFSHLFLDEKPSCGYEACGSLQCFECPASNYVNTGHMQYKLCGTCAIHHVERELFDRCISDLNISDYDYRTLWFESANGRKDHMITKHFDKDLIGLPIANTEDHKKEKTPIMSNNLGEIEKWQL